MTHTSFTDDFRRNFLTGVAALFPVLITLFLFSWLYRQIDATLGKKANEVCRQVLAAPPSVFTFVFPNAPEGVQATYDARLEHARENFPSVIGTTLGLVTVVVVVYLIGSMLRGYIGRRVVQTVDRFFERFPVIKTVYPHARQVADVVFGEPGRQRFSKVVAVQYPRRGMYSLGFLTGDAIPEVREKVPEDLLTVFVPTSPTPMTGFVVQVPQDEVIYLSMSVDEAIRFFISAGMLRSPRRKLGAPLNVSGPKAPEGLPEEAVEGAGPASNGAAAAD